jgi:sugar transferase (PEP-CTERM system associated)
VSFLRLSNPRFIASALLEWSIIFFVLYGLSAMTIAFAPDLVSRHREATVAVTSFIFLGGIFSTRTARLGEYANLRREIALVSIVSSALALMAFVGSWTLLGTPRALGVFLLVEGAIAVPAAVALWRWLTLRYQLLDGYRERVLIVGAGETAKRVCQLLRSQHAADFAVTGFADENESQMGQVLSMGVRVLTDFDSLTEYAPKRVDRIIVALDEKRGKLPIPQLLKLRLAGFEIEDATTFVERISGKIAVESMLPSWLIFSDGFKTSEFRRASKRLADVFLSLILLLLATPLMVLTALAIRLDSRGPVFFRQKRIGLKGRVFRLLKFRSMIQDAESQSGPVWAHANDPRVTRVGRILRLLRIDELPQLINVLRGEMSFVGPRPERKHFVEQLEKLIPYYRLRLAARPGITGWAQVRYQYGASVEDAIEKLKYDLYYIKNANPLFDVYIVLRTIKVVLTGRGAR